ncbi:hypothetical protein DRO32_03405 [Candidatus Bathyarchaeota archaeon]|nr:MAG: hypothetical protein DRO32_03405 [Candidatus Bathyarchaeota archaeon]
MLLPVLLRGQPIHDRPRPPAPGLHLHEPNDREGGLGLREKRYRSRLRIVADILAVLVEEGGSAGPTRILYGANLSHDRLVRYLREMEEKELIERRNDDGRTVYGITEKGKRLLDEVRKIEELLRAFGLEI